MRTVLVVLALALTGPALGARTESPTDVATLASTAKSVVHVRVAKAETFRERYDVKTTYTLVPLQTLSGDRAEALSLTLPGGVLDGVTVQAQGVPVWSVGDEAIVFLPPEGPVSLDAVLTVRDGQVVDPAGRAVPERVEGVREMVPQSPASAESR